MPVTGLVDMNARPLLNATEVVATRMEAGNVSPVKPTVLIPNVEPLGGSGAQTLWQTTVQNMRWREWYNPLRDVTMARVVAAIEFAARGVLPDLMWLSFFVEKHHYITRSLLERRQTAIEQLDWQVKIPREYKKKKSSAHDDATDPAMRQLAQDQQGALKEWLATCENFDELTAHLVLAPFRGFSIAQPVRDDGRTVDFENAVRFAVLDQWNFCREARLGDYFWNPRALQQMPLGLGEANRVNRASIICRECAWPIAMIAVTNCLRSALVEKNWDAYHEIFGIPNPIIVGPPSVPKGQEAAYFASAQLISMGGGGYLPNGSEVFYPSEKAGIVPFKERMEHLEKELVLVGTGGMETMLSSPTAKLNNSGNKNHQDAWQTIARAEARRIGRVVTRDFVQKFLAAKFPGRPALAYLELQGDDALDASLVCVDAAALVPTGYTIDMDWLEEQTGYKLAPVAAPAATPGAGGRRAEVSQGIKALNSFDPDQPRDADGKWAEFADGSLAGKIPNGQSFKLRNVSDEDAAKIKDITGFDYRGKPHEIDSDHVRHIDGAHGNPAREEPRGQIAVTREHLHALPRYLDKPDNIEPGDRPNSIRVTKRINGTVAVTESTGEKGNRLLVTGMRIYKGKVPPHLATSGDKAGRVQHTSETGGTVSHDKSTPGSGNVKALNRGTHRHSETGEYVSPDHPQAVPTKAEMEKANKSLVADAVAKTLAVRADLLAPFFDKAEALAKDSRLSDADLFDALEKLADALPELLTKKNVEPAAKIVAGLIGSSMANTVAARGQKSEVSGRKEGAT